MDIIYQVSQKKMQALVNGEIADIKWIRPTAVPEIYEVSVYYPNSGGYHTWYMVIVNRQFLFLACTQYVDEFTQVIRWEEWALTELRKQSEKYLDEQAALCSKNDHSAMQ